MYTRILCSAAALVAFSTVTLAQTGLGRASLRGPVIVRPFPTTSPDGFGARPRTYVPHPSRPGSVFGSTIGGWWPGDEVSDGSRRAAENGFVQVDVQPMTAQ